MQRLGNTLIPAVIVILAIAATIGVYAFSVWPTDQELNVNTVQVTQPKNTNRTGATNVNTSITTNTNTTTVDAAKDWKTYTNSTYNYSIKYPSTWRATEEFGVDMVQLLLPGVDEKYSGPNDLKGAITVTTKEAGDTIQDPRPVTVNGYPTVQGKVLGIVPFQVTEFDRSTTKVRVRWSQKFTDPVYSQILNTITFTDSTVGWKTYTNSTIGYKVKYPATWKISENKDKSTEIVVPENQYTSCVECPIAKVLIGTEKSDDFVKDDANIKTVTVSGINATQGDDIGMGTNRETYVPHKGQFVVISWPVAYTFEETYKQIRSTLTFTK